MSAAIDSGLGDWVRRFGDGDLIACSTLQPNLEVFETSFGRWAYRRVRGMEITLGGPLCAEEDKPELIRRFLSSARRPILFYVREALLPHLEGTGLHGVGIGVDKHADLAALLASPERAVASASRKARKAGVQIAPLDLEVLDAATRSKLEAINALYLKGAECTVEMGFINYPMSYEPDGMRRVFSLTRREGERDDLFGYAVLNPIFDRGEVVRYLLDILRFGPTRLWGVWLSTVHALASRLHDEGFGLSLGYCPLHKPAPAPLIASRSMQAQIDWMARYLSTAQYLTRLRELKALIPGQEEQRYMASFTPLAPVALYAFMEALGVGFGTLFGPDLFRVLGRGVRARIESIRGSA